MRALEIYIYIYALLTRRKENENVMLVFSFPSIDLRVKTSYLKEKTTNNIYLNRLTTLL